MKWKAKPKFKDGDYRTVQRFSFIPKRLDNDEVIWLEWYYEKQKYLEACMIGDMTFPSMWDKISRYQQLETI